MTNTGISNTMILLREIGVPLDPSEENTAHGHRENILDSGFTKMGIACYYCNGMYYWVQHFSS